MGSILKLSCVRVCHESLINMRAHSWAGRVGHGARPTAKCAFRYITTTTARREPHGGFYFSLLSSFRDDFGDHLPTSERLRRSNFDFGRLQRDMSKVFKMAFSLGSEVMASFAYRGSVRRCCSDP